MTKVNTDSWTPIAVEREDQRMRDLAFQTLLRAAMDKGLEKMPTIVPDEGGPRHIRLVTPPFAARSLTGSSAASCLDFSDDPTDRGI